MRITVRALKGRVVYTAPTGGKLIPDSGDGITVERDSWVNRLLTVHKDIEIVTKQPTPPAAKAKGVA